MELAPFPSVIATVRSKGVDMERVNIWRHILDVLLHVTSRPPPPTRSRSYIGDYVVDLSLEHEPMSSSLR